MKESLHNLIMWIKEKVENVNILPLLQKKLFRTWILSYCFMRFLDPSYNNYDLHILKDKMFKNQKT